MSELMKESSLVQYTEILQSVVASRTLNPMRKLVDGTKLHPNPDKPLIALSLGDPTVGGNLRPDPAILDALNRVIVNCKYNGYGPAVGIDVAREAVARFVCDDRFLEHVPCEQKEMTNGIDHKAVINGGTQCAANGKCTESEQEEHLHASWGEWDGWRLRTEDVVMASGCSGALEMCLEVLGSEGQNVLIPRPGFSLYRTLAESQGLRVKAYNLLPESGWQVDLQHLESLADKNTVAILVNNPSNPCGSVYTREHLIDIVAVARRLRLPIIADEVYSHMVFEGEQYIPIGAISGNVPVLHCGGLTKTWLVPGWRMGWIALWDRSNVLKQVRSGLFALATRLVGPNTLVQAAIPDLLRNTPRSFYNHTIQVCQLNAELMYAELSHVPGLRPVRPRGAFYMMVGLQLERFPDFKSEVDFFRALVEEQSVMCIPASVFDYPAYVRIVLTLPADLLREAAARISDFCAHHYRPATADATITEFKEPLPTTQVHSE